MEKVCPESNKRTPPHRCPVAVWSNHEGPRLGGLAVRLGVRPQPPAGRPRGAEKGAKKGNVQSQ
jgi:hypothetical protein